MKNCVFFVVILFLFQCKSPEEKKIEYYDDNQQVIKARYGVINGVKEGEELIYSKSGNVIERHINVNGKRSGLSFFYKNDGRLYLQLTYRDGVKDGPYYIFFPNRNIAEEGNFLANEKHGEINQYFEYDSGKIQYSFYQFNMDGVDQVYYKKEFDAKGEWVGHYRSLFVKFSNDTLLVNSQVVVKFELNRIKTMYDSVSIIFEILGSNGKDSFRKDSLKLKEGRGEWLLTPVHKGSFFLRGRWRAYKTWASNDSTYNDITVGYFEEPFYVKN